MKAIPLHSTLFILLLWLTAAPGLAGSEVLVRDSFDWGPEVAGRESLQSGSSVGGLPPSQGAGQWEVGSGDAVFVGSPGEGGLSLSDSANASLRIPLQPKGNVRAVVEAEVRLTSDHPARGFFIGFEERLPDKKLLPNQTTDRLYVRLSGNNRFFLQGAVAGESVDAVQNNVDFSAGDRVRIELEYDATTSTATAVCNNLTQNSEYRLSILLPQTPQLGAFVINATGGSTLLLRDIAIQGTPTQTEAKADAKAEQARRQPRKPTERPNLILLMADDMGQEMGCYGDPMELTPHLDRLAREGVRFNNAHVTAASCSPSRGSVFTGLFPHQHGLYSLSHNNWGRLHDDVPKLPNELKKLGYHTSIIGKTHFEPFDQFEFDAFIYDPRKVNIERDVRWMNEQALAMLDQLPEGQPYFMVMSYIDPHRGGGQGRLNPDEGIGRYERGKNLIFPRVRRGLPPAPPAPEETVPLPYLGVDTPEVRLENSDYYAAIQRLDLGMGELLDELEKRGDLDNTLIIFIGDHGADVTRGKIAAYASATRIPMLARWPGQIEPGLVREELVSTIDLFPTFLAAAGAEPAVDPRQTGQLLQKLFQSGRADWRQGMGTEFIAHVPWHYYPRYTWFEDGYHLIHNLHASDRPNPLVGVNFCYAWWEVQNPEYEGTPIRAVYDRVTHPPEFELYNLKDDPHEMVNLADRPEYRGRIQQMRERIQHWRTETDDPFLDPAYDASYFRHVMQMKADYDAAHRR